MVAANETILQVIDQLWKEAMQPKSYCITGRKIRDLFQSSSPEFTQHIDVCEQCRIALAAEKADVRQ